MEDDGTRWSLTRRGEQAIQNEEAAFGHRPTPLRVDRDENVESH
jgi:hypothetical protein